jgi:hypothetical protein
MVLLAAETLKIQQTPNPDAQFPLAVPPLAEHSLVVKQVPLRLFDEPDGSES